MNCFIDFVGLKGCEEENPRSGQFINGLAGISLAAMDSLANEEQLSYKGFWADVQKRAARRIGTDIMGRSNKFVRTETLFADTRFGYVADPIAALPNAPQLQGIYLDFGHLRYAKARLSQVGIHAMADGTMDLLIYDFTTAKLLETIPLILVEGYNLIPLNKEYLSESTQRRLFICYDGKQALALARTGGWEFLDGGDCRDCFGVGRFYGAAYGGYVLDTKTKFYKNFHGSGSFGLQLDFQVRCSLEAFICPIADLFTSAWMNLLGAEIMLERQTSPRINKYTTVNPEKVAGLLEYFETQYSEAMDTALENLTFPNDVCFPCHEQVSYQHNL